MQPVTETIGMEKPPDNHFRLGILAFNPAHIVAAGGFIVHIGHGVKVQANGLSGGEGSGGRGGFGGTWRLSSYNCITPSGLPGVSSGIISINISPLRGSWGSRGP